MKKFDSHSPNPALDPEKAPIQTDPSWPSTPPPELVTGASNCEPYRDCIEAQLRLKRKVRAIYQDLIVQYGFMDELKLCVLRQRGACHCW
jgi:hypothetical protein